MSDPLRSYDAWLTSVQNFSWLSKVVPGATDVDLLVEHQGHFLFIEAKPWTNGVIVPVGQHRALRALSQQPRTSVWVIGEGRNEDLYVSDYATSRPVYISKAGGRVSYWPPSLFEKHTKATLSEKVSDWWLATEKDKTK